MAYKPILFNTEMVQAIQAGRKTQTRRVAKLLCGLDPREDGLPPGEFEFFISPRSGAVHWEDLLRSVTIDGKRIFAPCMPGDILWVRETWNYGEGEYRYKADDEMPDGWHTTAWRPSIHMPREAARIFLRVKDVRVERLQDCGDGWCVDIEKEGVKTPQNPILYVNDDKFHDALRAEMKKLWDSTIKPADLYEYGWNANPWVWVIEFEKCEKPEGWCAP